MQTKARIPCDRCNGVGLIPHVRRLIGSEFDPWDLRVSEICDKCGGSGLVPGSAPAEEKNGTSADQCPRA